MSSHDQGIDGVIARLNMAMKIQSDPALLNDILKNDMYLTDMVAFTTMLGEQLTTPQDLSTFMEQIRSGMISKHPAMNEFASVAIRDNLIPPNYRAGKSTYHARNSSHLPVGTSTPRHDVVSVHEVNG
jgi:hypothetical protein